MFVSVSHGGKRGLDCVYLDLEIAENEVGLKVYRTAAGFEEGDRRVVSQGEDEGRGTLGIRHCP